MFCGQCGKNLPDDVRFCQSCGRPTAPDPIVTSFTNAAAAVAPALSSSPAAGTASYQQLVEHYRGNLQKERDEIMSTSWVKKSLKMTWQNLGLTLWLILWFVYSLPPFTRGDALVGITILVIPAVFWSAYQWNYMPFVTLSPRFSCGNLKYG